MLFVFDLHPFHSFSPYELGHSHSACLDEGLHHRAVRLPILIMTFECVAIRICNDAIALTLILHVLPLVALDTI